MKAPYRHSALLAVIMTLPYTQSWANENTLSVLEAVQMTLENSATIKVSSLSVEAAKGIAKAQSGAFDLNTAMSLSSSSTLSTAGIPAELGLPGKPIYSDIDIHVLGAQLTQPFRNGINASAGYTITQVDQRQGGIEATTYNTGALSFNLVVPLLKGAGTVSAAANETAAAYDSEAALLDFKHSISATVLSTVSNYWKYAAAYSINKYNEQTRNTVQDWYNAKKLDVLKGFLSEKQGALAESTQQLEQEKLGLATTMGISMQQVSNIGLPDTQSFPDNWEEKYNKFNNNATKESWRKIAEENRFDLQAEKSRLLSAQTKLKKAEKDLSPSLNASFGYGSGGFSYGNGLNDAFRSSYEYVRSPSLNGSLTFSYPIGNNVAQGTLDANKASEMISKMKHDEKIRSIKLSVDSNVAALYGSLKKTIEADKTLKSYVDSIQKKINIGNFDKLEDLNSLLTLQDRLDSAAVNYINSLRDLAISIAQSRHEVGVLLVSSNDGVDKNISLQQLTEIPAF